jgi:hypothetical protein
MTNDLKDKYLPTKLFFIHKKTIFIIFGDFNYFTDHFIIIIGRFYRSERIFLSIFNENRPKGPETVCRAINSLKNQ